MIHPQSDRLQAASLLRRIWKWLVVALAVALAVSPAAYLVHLVKQDAVNVLLNDDFEYAELMVKARTGGLTFHDFTYAHGEHRVVLSRIIIAANAAWFHGDMRNTIYVTLMVALLTAFNLFRLLRRSVTSLGWQAWGMFAINLLIFSPVQWQNWLWGTQMCYYLPTFFLSCTLLALTSRLQIGARVGLGAFCAFCASFSLGHGMLAWPAALPVLLVLPEFGPRRRRAKLIALWMLAAAATVGLYLINFKNEAHPSHAYARGAESQALTSATYALHHPLKGLEFAAIQLGGPLARGSQLMPQEVGVYLGLGLLILSALGLWGLARGKNRELWRAACPWISLLLFALLTTCLLVGGRLSSNMERQAGLPRYTTFAIPAYVGLLGLLLVARRKDILATAVLSVMITLNLPNWVLGAEMMDLWREARLQSRAVLAFINVVTMDDISIRLLDLDPAFGQKEASRLSDAGLIKPPLLKDTRLDNLTIMPNQRLGDFDPITRGEGGWHVAGGVASHPDQHLMPVDAILLTYRDVTGHWIVFALVSPAATSKLNLSPVIAEYEYTLFRPPDRRDTLGWSGKFQTKSLPSGPQQIQAWVMDAEKMRVWRLGKEQTFVNDTIMRPAPLTPHSQSAP